jgi:hypothetical protein
MGIEIWDRVRDVGRVRSDEKNDKSADAESNLKRRKKKKRNATYLVRMVDQREFPVGELDGGRVTGPFHLKNLVQAATTHPKLKRKDE